MRVCRGERLRTRRIVTAGGVDLPLIPSYSSPDHVAWIFFISRSMRGFILFSFQTQVQISIVFVFDSAFLNEVLVRGDDVGRSVFVAMTTYTSICFHILGDRMKKRAPDLEGDLGTQPCGLPLNR